MKKFIKIIIISICILPSICYADNIYNIDMDVYIDKDGTASIREVWNVKADSGTEWYKSMYNLGNSHLTDYEVSMDGISLTYKNWDINESIYEKNGYYGINYTDDGIELCFGKGDFRNHKFTITYKLTNYIFNTEDSQVLYWTLLPEISVENFTVDITSYYTLPDTLDVWGYGYKGYAYVKDGKISMSNEGNLKNDRVVLLAKFPSNTFNVTNSYSDYSTFNDVYKTAEKGTFIYKILDILDELYKYSFLFICLIVVIFIILLSKHFKKNKYCYKQKRIIKKDVLPYRDIPCNKDIFIANSILKLNSEFNFIFYEYHDSNIFGAIILKWIKEDKIKINNVISGLFDKETSTLDLSLNPKFDNKYEEKLYNYMKKASKNDILEPYELQKWCISGKEKLINLLKNMSNDYIKTLKKEGKIWKRKNKLEGNAIYIIDDSIYDESVKLCGLNKFLKDFTTIAEKEAIEVKIWDEYLMFAYLLGIADEVLEQLKKLYPKLDVAFDVDYNAVSFINELSTTTRIATLNFSNSSRPCTDFYSSGGGGSSSSGGGFGSFGGGGSAGGR